MCATTTFKPDEQRAAVRKILLNLLDLNDQGVEFRMVEEYVAFGGAGSLYVRRVTLEPQKIYEVIESSFLLREVGRGR